MKPASALVHCLALAMLFAMPAAAAWSPLLPGWTAQELPLPASVQLGVVLREMGCSIDPASGDLLVAGFDASSTLSSALLRVTPLGEVGVDFDNAPMLRPCPDWVGGDVYFQDGEWITHRGVGGAALPQIGNLYSGPIAVSADGDLYTLWWHAPVNTRLDLMRFDPVNIGWIFVETLSRFPYPSQTEMPSYMQFDEEGRLFFVTGDRNAFRVDGTTIVALGGRAEASVASVGPGFLFLGDSFIDPAGASAQPRTRFAAPDASDEVLVGSGVTPDGRVLFLTSHAPPGDRCSLVVFTRDVTPTVRRSWGAIKAADR